MNSNENSSVKHVLHEGSIYIVDYSSDVPVWSLAMPLSVWASRQKAAVAEQFPNFES
ncbi:MAG TPA: hypothetical protein V6C76_01915 [Drouetiella sp.]